MQKEVINSKQFYLSPILLVRSQSFGLLKQLSIILVRATNLAASRNRDFRQSVLLGCQVETGPREWGGNLAYCHFSCHATHCHDNKLFIWVSMDLAECSSFTNWGGYKSNWITTNQIKCWFCVRGENQSTRGKTSQNRVENQQTYSTYDGWSGNRTRAIFMEGECSHFFANSALQNVLSCHVISCQLMSC